MSRAPISTGPCHAEFSPTLRQRSDLTCGRPHLPRSTEPQGGGRSVSERFFEHIVGPDTGTVDYESRPLGAFLASLFGGLLILVEGVLLSFAGFAANAAGDFVSGSLLSGLGFLEGLFGFIIMVLSILMYAYPHAHVVYGIGILVLSLLSLVGGAGFALGLILGVIGGVWGLIFHPDDEPLMLVQPGFSASSWATSDFPAAEGVQLIEWPNCHSTVFADSAVCPKCETPLRHA